MQFSRPIDTGAVEDLLKVERRHALKGNMVFLGDDYKQNLYKASFLCVVCNSPKTLHFCRPIDTGVFEGQFMVAES